MKIKPNTYFQRIKLTQSKIPIRPIIDWESVKILNKIMEELDNDLHDCSDRK